MTQRDYWLRSVELDARRLLYVHTSRWASMVPPRRRPISNTTSGEPDIAPRLVIREAA